MNPSPDDVDPAANRWRRASGSAAWVIAGQGYAKLASFTAYFVMVRHLDPGDVGLVALCWLWIVVGDTFFDAGLSQAYVRDGRRDHRAESTLFWSLSGLATFWMALCLAAAPAFAHFSGEPDVIPVMLALSAIYPCKALGWTQLSIQVVERRVASIALRDVVATTAASALGMALAWAGFGPWALVARLVCLPAAGSLMLVLSVPWRPALTFDRAWLVRKLRFGLPLTAVSNVHWLVVLQIEGYLVGHTLGLAALGLVQFAKKPTEVLTQLMVSIQNVHLLRELSSVRDSPDAWRLALRRELALYAGIGIGVALASLGFAFLVMEPVWGERWSEAVPLVAILGLASPLIALQAVAVSALVARGALRTLLRVNLAGAAITCLLLWVGVRFGLVALAWAQSLGIVCVALLALAALRGAGPTPSGSARSADAD